MEKGIAWQLGASISYFIHQLQIFIYLYHTSMEKIYKYGRHDNRQFFSSLEVVFHVKIFFIIEGKELWILDLF